MEKTKECWDGTEIVTHRLIDGMWTKTRIECPPKPDEFLLRTLV